MAGFSGGTLGASKRYTDEQISLYGTTGFTPKGSWSAATNTPHLEDRVGTLGWVYEVIEPGTQFGYKFLVGDKVFYNASNKWDRSATGVESEAPMVVAYVDENTESFPTTRPSGQPLKNGDYVSVKSTAILPFEIENISGEKIPFDAYGDKAEFNGEDWQEKSYEAGKTNEIGIKNPVEEGVTGDEEYQNELNKKYSNEIKIGKSVISVKRLGEYFYEATYDGIADYIEGVNPVIGGCTSFVRGKKTYRSFDLKYNNVAEFLVKTKDFDGIALIQGMNDGNLDKEKIAQLPYHLADGCNRHGIVVTEHTLFNDFGFNGTGTKVNDLTKFPTVLLQNVKSMAELTTNPVINDFLDNAKIPKVLSDLGYALQFMITDRTTTYTLCPKDNGMGYEFIDISSLPKQTNFKWVNKATLDRNDSNLQSRATGTTRWNLIESGAELKELAFTKAYQTNARLDEFIGINGTTKDSTDEELQAIYEEAHAEYLIRERDGKTWQSVHSIVYGANGIEHLWIQENYDKDYIYQEKIDSDTEISIKKVNFGSMYVDEETLTNQQSAMQQFENSISQLQDGKVDKEANKGLSENNYSTTEKDKLSNISEGANKVSDNHIVENGTILIDGDKAIVYDDSDIRQQLAGFEKGYVIASESLITGTKDTATGNYTNVTAITGITLSNLKIGDNIYILDNNAPDYWVSQTSPSVSLNALSTKTDLTNYYNKSEVDTIANGKEPSIYDSGWISISGSKLYRRKVRNTVYIATNGYSITRGTGVGLTTLPSGWRPITTNCGGLVMDDSNWRESILIWCETSGVVTTYSSGSGTTGIYGTISFPV